MKKIILAILLASTSLAFAADQAVRVDPRRAAVSFNPNPTGWYVGVGASATVADTQFTGTFPAGTFGAGAGADFLVGYMLSADPVTGQFKAIEAGGTWRTASAQAVCDPASLDPCNFQSKYSLWQGFLLGGSLASITSYFPGGSGVAGLNGPISVTPTTHPYAIISIHEDFVKAAIAGVGASQVKVQPFLGVGFLQQLSPSQVSDTRLECTPPGTSMAVGIGSVKTGTSCIARQLIKF